MTTRRHPPPSPPPASSLRFLPNSLGNDDAFGLRRTSTSRVGVDRSAARGRRKKQTPTTGGVNPLSPARRTALLLAILMTATSASSPTLSLDLSGGDDAPRRWDAPFIVEPPRQPRADTEIDIDERRARRDRRQRKRAEESSDSAVDNDEGGGKYSEEEEEEEGDDNGVGGWEEQCRPSGPCELCPRNWKYRVDSVRVDGDAVDWAVCLTTGRRAQYDCVSLFREEGSNEKMARSRYEYRSCKRTEADEEFRMLRMQIMCLLVGMLSMRTVRRQRLASASLFDQRRMARLAAGNGVGGRSSVAGGVGGGSDGRGKYSMVSSANREETSIEFGSVAPASTKNKVPKSPAPPFQTV